MDERSIFTHIVDWSWALIAGLMAWLWKHLNGRIDSKASAAHLASVVKTLDDHIAEDRDVHNRIASKLDRIVEQHSETNVKLATLIGKFDGGNRA
jgi:CII-binding regulator of phage lambda lysogenization HflD